MRELSNLPAFCSTAAPFWRNNVAAAQSERVILVEVMGQDLRVALRSLTLANALRRIEPARIVVYTGADDEWKSVVWTYFDIDELTAFSRAYGAEEVFDVHALVDSRVAGERIDLTVAGVDLGGELPKSGIPEQEFEQIVDATVCRLAKVPRMDRSPALQAQRARTHRRSVEFAKVYDALMTQRDVVAVVSSHVDYNNFGLAVEAAIRHQVPVLFPQSTGGLKSYAIYPEDVTPGEPVRAALTRRIGTYFEKHVWENRTALHGSSERTMWRAKGNLGSPSWWRGRKLSSDVSIRDARERAAIRQNTAQRIGLDPDKPTVTVFNHGVSDALWTNHESFEDLGDWFERTAEYAAGRDDVNWLFLDHPLQDVYDGSNFFGNVADAHADAAWMHFDKSQAFSKNALIALTDLVLTVRGSVSNEYPAFGIPAIQAGWSEWSDCGFTSVADTSEQYFRLLDDHLVGLHEHRELMTAEQIERARLWAWFYRSATDVVSPLVPHWGMGQGDSMLNSVSVTMRHAESDADPAFVAVRRLWRRRDPLLTRVDWTLPYDDLIEALAPAGGAQ